MCIIMCFTGKSIWNLPSCLAPSRGIDLRVLIGIAVHLGTSLEIFGQRHMTGLFDFQLPFKSVQVIPMAILPQRGRLAQVSLKMIILNLSICSILVPLETPYEMAFLPGSYTNLDGHINGNYSSDIAGNLNLWVEYFETISYSE
jgi:hypothetical protein